MADTSPKVNPSERFAMIPESILFDADLPLMTRMVYAAVALHADQSSGFCYFNQRRLATSLGIARETLNRHLGALRDAGHLRIIPRTASDRGWNDSNQRTHNDYVLSSRVGVSRKPEAVATSRQVGYETADEISGSGTRKREELGGRARHAVATVAARSMDAGMSRDQVSESITEYLDEYGVAPAVADIRDVPSGRTIPAEQTPAGEAPIARTAESEVPSSVEGAAEVPGAPSENPKGCVHRNYLAYCQWCLRDRHRGSRWKP